MKQSHMCPAEITVDLLAGRWKIVILWFLLQDVQRFSDLRRRLTGVSQKVLTQQLREMEKDGIIVRKVFPDVPPKVEYSLTALGRSLEPIVAAMHQWGVAHQPSQHEP